MTENRKHLVRPADLPPQVRGQRGRRGRRGRAGRLPAREPGPGGDQEPPRVRPVPGQAPGLPDAGEPQLRPLLRDLPRRAGIHRSHRDPAARPAGRCSSSPTRPTPTATSSRGTCAPSPPAPPPCPSLSHDWRDQHASWNQGAMDGWLLTHIASDGEANGSFTMGYYTQEDIPFHWALAKAFTLADNYHCSVMGPTDPNRLFWEEGGNDPQGRRRPGPGDRRRPGPDLRKRGRDPLQRRDQLQVLPGDRLAAGHRSPPTSPSSRPPGWCPPRSTTP